MSRGFRRVIFPACGLLAGCYDRSVDGEASTYGFSGWVPLLVILGGAAALPLGWWARRSSAKACAVLLTLGGLLLLVVAPGVLADRVVVDDEHVEARYGFWFAPSVHHVRFEDVVELRYVEVTGTKGRVSHEMRFRGRGLDTVIHAGDLVRNAVPEILARAKAAGVRVVD